jgi:hypothetical protein
LLSGGFFSFLHLLNIKLIMRCLVES